MHIYKTTNLINGKIYIGQTSKPINTDYLGSGKTILKAVRKYGRSNFNREIIEECESKEKLNKREIYWIDFFDSINRKVGYNISIGGEGGNLGDIVNKKLSKIAKESGRMKGNTLRKGKVPHNKGKNMSEEQKNKLRKPKNKEHKENLSKAKMGKGTKSIICLNDNKKYNSIKETAETLGLTVSNIVAVLKGRAEKTKGYYFKYI